MHQCQDVKQPKGGSPCINCAVVLLQVFYYADRIFESAGVHSSSIQYVTVSIGAINVVMTLLAVSLCWGSLSSPLPLFKLGCARGILQSHHGLSWKGP